MVQFVQKLCQCCNEIKPKKEISGSKSFLVYILTKIHNCGKFHQYSIFKVLRSDLASTKWPFWEVFGPFLPQIWSRIAEIPTRGRALAKKYSLKDSSIYGKGKDPKLALLVQFWHPPFSPADGQNRKKEAVLRKIFSHWTVQICQNSGFISSHLSGENTITFLQYLCYFC